MREHSALRASVVGTDAPDDLAGSGDVPSVYASYRFAAKLRAYSDLLTACIDRVMAGMHAEHPDRGRDIAIDGFDMPA